MPLPIKSLHTIWDAMRFIRRATGETAMPDQILDLGSQGRYRLYALIERHFINPIGTKRIWPIRDLIVELRLSVEQAAILGRYDEVEISACWHNGTECNFVRRPIGPSSSSWLLYPASINLGDIRLLGAELTAFAGSLAEPQQTAPVTNTATSAPVANPKAKRRTWRDVSSHYIVKVMQAEQYATCKELYHALCAKAGPDSPFDKGTGANRGSLFVREIAQSLKVKTLQNEWQTLRKLAQK